MIMVIARVILISWTCWPASLPYCSDVSVAICTQSEIHLHEWRPIGAHQKSQKGKLLKPFKCIFTILSFLFLIVVVVVLLLVSQNLDRVKR